MMRIRKFFAFLWLGISLSCWITPSNAQNPMGQTLQINTHFRSITGNPVWLLIIRDLDSGVVLPYMFDIKNNDNFWLAFSFSRNYVITASHLKFGPFAVINNFCHLENKILSGKSMIISLSGHLTPSPKTFNCHVLTYNSLSLPIYTSQGDL